MGGFVSSVRWSYMADNLKTNLLFFLCDVYRRVDSFHAQLSGDHKLYLRPTYMYVVIYKDFALRYPIYIIPTQETFANEVK